MQKSHTSQKARVVLAWSSGKDSAWTLHCLRQANEVDVVGLNCVGWEVLELAAARIGDVTRLPVAVSPNAGAPDMIDDRMVYPVSEVDLAERMGQLIESGVRIVAGCCGTGTEYIATLRALIDRSKAHRQLELE